LSTKPKLHRPPHDTNLERAKTNPFLLLLNPMQLGITQRNPAEAKRLAAEKPQT